MPSGVRHTGQVYLVTNRRPTMFASPQRGVSSFSCPGELHRATRSSEGIKAIWLLHSPAGGP